MLKASGKTIKHSMIKALVIDAEAEKRPAEKDGSGPDLVGCPSRGG